jgi:hypothetical protein
LAVLATLFGLRLRQLKAGDAGRQPRARLRNEKRRRHDAGPKVLLGDAHRALAAGEKTGLVQPRSRLKGKRQGKDGLRGADLRAPRRICRTLPPHR